MNYKYHNDGTNTVYTVNGKQYTRLEDVPEEHRAYFINLDKNKNGIPDSIEPLLSRMKDGSGTTSITKVIGSLFKSVGEQMTSDNSDAAETISLEEIKEKEKIQKPVDQRRTYDRNGRVVQPGESSFMPTLIKILVGILIGLAIAWYFGVIK